MPVAPPARLALDRLATPIGAALLVTDDEGRLRALEWEGGEARLRRSVRRHCGVAADPRPGRAPRAVTAALEAYFAGECGQLDAIACRTGGTPFQHLVWAALRRIPPGITLGYGELAARLGRPGAARAVGLANGANPVAVVIPCHRLVGANGALTGYAGGLARKRWLLDHEGA